MKNFRLCVLFLFCALAVPLLQAQVSFRLKSTPADLNGYFNDELIKTILTSGTIRQYRIPATGTLRFSASGYRSIE
jgi:hypothetical protein